MYRTAAEAAKEIRYGRVLKSGKGLDFIGIFPISKANAIAPSLNSLLRSQTFRKIVLSRHVDGVSHGRSIFYAAAARLFKPSF
ncbi:hypothetical protein GCM10010969_01650 [Saccharibacillus kuerlensis]|uniref:Uncharacterized protein n=1 Tax=Saccharibacillus kuerlensis TaxID=459527 RepID=A0ABQ2KR27_9BACL|nr:hypothetical protein GCM10010969_01650 [Saccharibacillus kuerlensis]